MEERYIPDHNLCASRHVGEFSLQEVSVWDITRCRGFMRRRIGRELIWRIDPGQVNEQKKAGRLCMGDLHVKTLVG